MKKYIYEYVRVKMVYSFLGLSEEVTRHKEAIDKYAALGWRYTGYIPVVKSSEGKTLELDLIFEKEIEE